MSGKKSGECVKHPNFPRIEPGDETELWITRMKMSEVEWSKKRNGTCNPEGS